MHDPFSRLQALFLLVHWSWQFCPCCWLMYGSTSCLKGCSIDELLVLLQMFLCVQACPVLYICLDMPFFMFMRSFWYILYVRSSRHNAMSSSLENNGSLHSLLDIGNVIDIASFCRWIALQQHICLHYPYSSSLLQSNWSLHPSPACLCKTQLNSETAGPQHFADLAAMLQTPRVRLLVEPQSALRCCR